MNNFFAILLLIAVEISVCYCQHVSTTSKRNIAIIKPADTSENIVEKAAKIVPSDNQYNWQKMEFIAFAHFGMNTFTDREWGEGTEDPKMFNPTEFNAKQWAKSLKESGVNMLILTAKHHDGFCLWPSKYTEHSVKNSPWKNGQGDVVLEAANACREFGLKFGVYLSPWDRNNINYGDSQKYNEYFMNQLKELLTNYGEITEVWFDGANGEGPNGKRQIYDWQSYYMVIRELQPKAVIFGMAPDIRWVGTESGYGRETEWSVLPIDLSNLDEKLALHNSNPLDQMYVPKDIMGDDLGSREKIYSAKGLYWYPAETDVSIRPGWFYHSNQDKEVKTPEKLVDIYFSSVGRNGVLLLNIPPDKRGLISQSDVNALKGMRKILANSFKTNFAEGAGIKSTNMVKVDYKSANSKESSYWVSSQKTDKSILEFVLSHYQTIDAAMIQEEIRVGQRIEEFQLEYWNGKSWQTFAKGTTVGYKRLLRFDPLKTKRIRLVINKSRLNPTIASFGLFKMDK